MIEVENLSKTYGSKRAVDHISFTARPGRVTGFLGPNGSGKSTTMRMIVGLDHPNTGRALINGRPYNSLKSPLTQVGALLEAKAVHKGRSARGHLEALAATHGFPKSRVDEVITMTGLGSVAGKRAGGFSLGMGQRLGIAAALLGDPEILILDEPVNGLDPEGVRWVRTMVRSLASEGRTVFLSSHLMSEMSITADDLIVIGRGRIITSGPVKEVIERSTTSSVRVASPQAAELMRLLGDHGSVTLTEPTVLDISGVAAPTVGEVAAQNGIVLHELVTTQASLEDAFMELTKDDVEYHAQLTNSGDQQPDSSTPQQTGANR